MMSLFTTAYIFLLIFSKTEGLSMRKKRKKTAQRAAAHQDSAAAS